MTRCLKCNKEISDKAKYCSDRCRMAYTRANKQPERTLNKPEQTNPNKIVKVEGICHGCGKEVGKLICICLDCVRVGVTHAGLDIKKCE